MFELTPFNRRRNQIQKRDRGLLDFDNFMEDFFNDTFFPAYFSHSGMIKVDIREEDDKYVLEAELPGITKDNINIDIDQDRLTLSVNQDEKSEETNENFVRRERRSYAMRRSFDVSSIDTDKISAKLDNGVLTMNLPKKENSEPKGRQIDIE